ncbi:hypothetical protein [Cerasicoccus maritimus]|uniref:hypothetical protein n=1 Tax=Cerasicoccus maritimus TaxID=490089 RepID=UPI002852B3FD|nr:hypothetical protein [Cerasicoccus maritimus]
MADRTPATDLPPHVTFPAHWEHVATHRVGRFITRVIHRLPDGGLHVWTSRRHRKRRGAVIQDSAGALSQVASHEHVGQVNAASKSVRQHFRLWGWRVESLSWWIGLIFIIGSICFVVGTVPTAYPGVLDWFGLQPYNYALVCFIGSVWFTIGSYLLLLEALNTDFDATVQLKAHELERYVEHKPQDQRTRRIRWMGFAGNRLDYWIATVQLIGAITFNINCGMGLVEGMNWVIADILVWTPSTVASCFFVTASYLGLVEVSHRKWAWLWWDVSWWINFFSLLGSFGFLISSVVGYFGQGPLQMPQWLGNYFALMMGSWFFLFGTYLMVPELVSEDCD